MKKIFAVFGNPIEHSLSPPIHQSFARQHGIDIEYKKILSTEEQFSDDVDTFFSGGGDGCNVTVPFKELAYQKCVKLSAQAQVARAVNTLYLDQKKQLCGHNTDGTGLLNDLSNNLKLTINDRHIVILGAGGATRGILQPLIDQQPEAITIINRTVAKAEALARDFASLFSIQVVAADNLPDNFKPADLLINATSASLDAKLPVTDTSVISPDSACYDLAYSFEPTRFLEWTRSNGAQHNCDGRGMLVEQAAAAFYTWTNLKPDTTEIIENFQNL